jgi:hypothetical protein
MKYLKKYESSEEKIDAYYTKDFVDVNIQTLWDEITVMDFEQERAVNKYPEINFVALLKEMFVGKMVRFKEKDGKFSWTIKVKKLSEEWEDDTYCWFWFTDDDNFPRKIDVEFPVRIYHHKMGKLETKLDYLRTQEKFGI